MRYVVSVLACVLAYGSVNAQSIPTLKPEDKNIFKCDNPYASQFIRTLDSYNQRSVWYDECCRKRAAGYYDSPTVAPLKMPATTPAKTPKQPPSNLEKLNQEIAETEAKIKLLRLQHSLYLAEQQTAWDSRR